MRYILVITLILLNSSCKKPDYSVEYEAKCGKCNISYQDRDGNVVYVLNNSGSWEYNFAGIPGRYIYVSINALPDVDGFIEISSVKINVGNKEFRSSKTTSTFHTATASGYLED